MFKPPESVQIFLLFSTASLRLAVFPHWKLLSTWPGAGSWSRAQIFTLITLKNWSALQQESHNFKLGYQRWGQGTTQDYSRNKNILDEKWNTYYSPGRLHISTTTFSDAGSAAKLIMLGRVLVTLPVAEKQGTGGEKWSWIVDNLTLSQLEWSMERLPWATPCNRAKHKIGEMNSCIVYFMASEIICHTVKN